MRIKALKIDRQWSPMRAFSIMLSLAYMYVDAGSKINFLCRRQVATEIIFFSRQMENSGLQKVSIKFFLHSETQKREVFKDVSSLIT